MDWSIGNILWIIIGGAIIGMFIGDGLASLISVKETFGFDLVRHGLQVVVGVAAVWLVAVVFGKVRAGKATA